MASSRRKWDTQRDGRLAAEVAHVCVNGIAWFKTKPDDERVRQLRAIAVGLYGEQFAARDTESLLNRLIGDAIELLDTEERRAAARLGFGLRGTGWYRKCREDRQEAAGRKLAVSGTTYYQNARYEIATIIDISKKIELLELRRSALDISEVMTPYARRPNLEAAIKSAMHNSPLIVLVGEGGTGKTTLAKEWVGRKHCLIIEGNNERDMLLSIGLALDLEAEGLGDTALKLRFRKLLEHKRHAPLYVMIDNVDEWELVAPIIPENPASKVIITTRERLVKRECIYVPVGSLTDDEAAAMIRLRLPDVADEELSVLKRLRGRAIAIAHVCAFMQRGPELRTAILNTIQKDVVASLDYVAGFLNERALTAIYSHIVNELRARPDAEPAVRLLMFRANRWFVPDYVDLFWLFIMSYDDRDVGELALASAMSTLQRYQLANVVKLTRTSYDGTDYTRPVLAMHELTAAIMRKIFEPEIIRLNLAIARGIAPNIKRHAQRVAALEAGDSTRLGIAALAELRLMGRLEGALLNLAQIHDEEIDRLRHLLEIYTHRQRDKLRPIINDALLELGATYAEDLNHGELNLIGDDLGDSLFEDMTIDWEGFRVLL